MYFKQTRLQARLCGIVLFAATLHACTFGNTQSADTMPQVAYKAQATTGEGAIWHPGRQSLFWVDIEGKTLYEYLPQNKNDNKWQFDRMISTVVPESDTTVVVALQNEIVRVNLSSGRQQHIAHIDDKNGKVRCNDGKCDAQGRLWIGTMGLDAAPGAGTLYCIPAIDSVVPKIDHVTISNGIVWSADQQYMYYIDTPTQQIVRYRHDPATGAIVYDDVAVEIPAAYGSPDGMTIDSKGNLWVAHWGGRGVYCWDPHTGKLLEKIELPAPHVASCAFGGSRLDTLYITTARAGLNPEELRKYPQSGSLYYYVPGVTGVAPNYMKHIQ